ncbi:MAG: FIST C-terminal domain-containing protein [Oscillospiraceae bacterium]|nr:FIST C-terminal domain-containing protein [Oscillospiraceae bacterium]
MKSNSAISYELEDMKIAAAELAKAVDVFPLLKSSIGILYFSTELDAEKLMSEIKKLLPFDIMGCSTQAVLNEKTGMNEFSSSLLVLTADDCDFNIFVSEPLTSENIKRQITGICESVTRVKHDLKLILLNCPHMPDIIFDNFPEAFSEGTGGLPVFGGAAGYSIDNDISLVTFNENLYTDRLVCCFISGNLAPVFSAMGYFSLTTIKTQIATKTDGDVIYTIDDMSFVDYLESMGIVTSEPEMYASIILKVKWGDDDGKDGGVYRSISSLNKEDGSGKVGCCVPQGSEIYTTTYKSDDIKISTKVCIDTIIEQIRNAESEDYKYTTVLCGSCWGRYLCMFPSKKIEGDIIKESAPPEMNFAGYYTNGEICPIAFKNGVAVNRAHNATITMCAF